MVNVQLELYKKEELQLADLITVLGLTDAWQSTYTDRDEEVFHLELEVNGGLEELSKSPIIVEQDIQTHAGALTKERLYEKMRETLLQLGEDPKLKDSGMVLVDFRYNAHKKETKVVIRYNKADKSEVLAGLRGNAFVKSVQKYDEHREGWMYRQCGLCFYRDGEKNTTRDCQILVTDTPKKLFGIPETERMPEKIDGRQVGNYCPNFVDFRAE